MKKQNITFANKFGYMMGDVANNLTFGLQASFLMAFYTDVLGITAAAVGTLFLVARLWDAVNDPLMGSLVDKMFKRRIRKHNKSREELDKFRPYLVKGAIPVVIIGVIMFYAPNLEGIQALIWAYATYILWGMSYTFVNIPYGSLQAVMTQDATERSSLSVARGLGGMVGTLFPRTIVPLFLAQFAHNEARGYLLAAAILGALGFISYLVSYFTVEENITPDKEVAQKPFDLKKGFKVLIKNRAFVAVSLGSIAMLIGMMTNGQMMVYYFRENLQAVELMSIAGVVQMLPMALVAPFLSKVVAKYGTKKTVYLSCLLSAIFFAVILLLPDNAIIFTALILISGLFMAIPNMLVWGMVSDTIDYNQYLSGQRQEGAIYGSYSFVRKAGQALAGFVGGQGLSLVAYNPEAAEQTASTLFGIKFLTVGIPAVGMFIGFLAFKYIWNLNPEKKEEIMESINAG